MRTLVPSIGHLLNQHFVVKYVGQVADNAALMPFSFYLFDPPWGIPVTSEFCYDADVRDELTKYAEPEQKSANKSQFERGIENGTHTVKLPVQYRCHTGYTAIINSVFYPGQVISDVHDEEPEDVETARRVIRAFTKGKVSRLYAFIDCYGTYMAMIGATKSKEIEWELFAVMELARQFVTAGFDPIEMAIITPYATQRDKARSLVAGTANERIHISTIDGYQGHQKNGGLRQLCGGRQYGLLHRSPATLSRSNPIATQ